MENPIKEIIDLTSIDLDCFTPRCGPLVVCDDIIDLANESFQAEKDKERDKTKNNQRKSKAKEIVKKTIEKDKERNSSKIGHCSICWEKLGKNPLASTICGHVYCLLCLEKSLKRNKRCPTCRHYLKGSAAYHPLYLELN